LDTLKTRLQSPQGFFAAGGFRGIYNGLGSAVVGSAPGAALFFVTYESVKSSFSNGSKGIQGNEVLVHGVAASLGEIAACAVRVPTEVVKQRVQAGQHVSSSEALRAILRMKGSRGWISMWKELYRGWSITVMREVPFTVIQFPLWEAMKRWAVDRRTHKEPGSVGNVMGKENSQSATAMESAVFGSMSGAIAGALTTPLDVLKTRLMLAKEKQNIMRLCSSIYRAEGIGAFSKGIGPRTTWIGIGGAVFLGSYQFVMNNL